LEATRQSARLRPRRLLLFGLAAVSVVVALRTPQLWVFPLWFLAWFCRDRLRWVNAAPRWLSFIGAGTLLGLLTECFAIAQNWSTPPEDRILLSPDPLQDLLLGFFYYLFVMTAWYAVARVYWYRPWEVFMLTGLYGICVEETGGVLLRMTSVTGVLYALVVACVYGIFPMLALLLTRERFAGRRTWRRFPWACAALFVQYALYGNLVYPALR